jgi:hypothetical protein
MNRDGVFVDEDEEGMRVMGFRGRLGCSFDEPAGVAGGGVGVALG